MKGDMLDMKASKKNTKAKIDVKNIDVSKLEESLKLKEPMYVLLKFDEMFDRAVVEINMEDLMTKRLLKKIANLL